MRAKFCLNLLLCLGILYGAQGQSPYNIVYGREKLSEKFSAAQRDTITRLEISEPDAVGDFALLRAMPALRRLDLNFSFLPARALSGKSSLVRVDIEFAEVIEYEAFKGCNGLEYVKSGKWTHIGSGAFEGCRALTDIELPRTLVYLGAMAFRGCTSLREAAFPPGLQKIGELALSDCPALKKVYCFASTPPELLRYDPKTNHALTLLGNRQDTPVLYVPKGRAQAYRMAAGWREFREIVEMETTASIERSAYGEKLIVDNLLPGMLRMSLPDALFDKQGRIESHSFSSASITGTMDARDFRCLDINALPGLKFATFDVSGASIAAYSGWNGTIEGKSDYPENTLGYHFIDFHIQSIKLPATLKSVGGSAFTSWSRLDKLVIPDGVTDIGANVLTRIEEVYIPASLSSVKNSSGSTGYITVSKDHPFWCSIDGAWFSKDMNLLISWPRKTATGDVVVPSGVRQINTYAFYALNEMTSVTLPASLEMIYSQAFVYCRKLRSVYMLNSVPPHILDAFRGQVIRGDKLVDVNYQPGCTLYVPRGSAERYRQAEGWKDFEKIVER